MKTLKNIAIAACAVFMLAACGGNSPEAIAQNFQKALMTGDFQEAAKYVTKTTAPMLEQMAIMVSEERLKEMQEEFKGVKLSVVGKEVNEDEATITLEITSADGDTDTNTYDLVKEDGSWKVDFKK